MWWFKIVCDSRWTLVNLTANIKKKEKYHMGPMRTQEYILTVWSAGKRKCQDAEGNCLLLIGSESSTSFLDQSQIRKRNTNAILYFYRQSNENCRLRGTIFWNMVHYIMSVLSVEKHSDEKSAAIITQWCPHHKQKQTNS